MGRKFFSPCETLERNVHTVPYLLAWLYQAQCSSQRNPNRLLLDSTAVAFESLQGGVVLLDNVQRMLLMLIW
jgi:hypothetical protein